MPGPTTGIFHSLRKASSVRLKTGIHFIAGKEDRVTGGYVKRYRNWRRNRKM
jgi:hypothetical protein